MKARALPYTFATLKERALESKHSVLTKDGHIYCQRKEWWLFTEDERYVKNKQKFKYTKSKVRFNIKNPDADKIAKAYDALATLRCKYREFILVSKVLDFSNFSKDIPGRIEEYDNEPYYKSMYPDIPKFNANDGKIYLQDHPEKLKKINKLIDYENRYRNGGQILFYIFTPMESKFDDKMAAIQKKIIKEAKACLKEAGIEAAPTPDSDFPISDCEYASIRVDKDEKDIYVEPSDALQKFEFVDNEVLKRLVEPKHLRKENFASHPIQDEKAKPHRKPVDKIFVIDVFEEIANTVNANNLIYWKQQASSIPKLYPLLETLALYADKNSNISGANRTVMVVDLIATMKSMMENPVKTIGIFKPESLEKIKLLIEGVESLIFHADLKGADKLNHLRKEIATKLGLEIKTTKNHEGP